MLTDKPSDRLDALIKRPFHRENAERLVGFIEDPYQCHSVSAPPGRADPVAGIFIRVIVLWELVGHLPLPLGVAGHEGSTFSWVSTVCACCGRRQGRGLDRGCPVSHRRAATKNSAPADGARCRWPCARVVAAGTEKIPKSTTGTSWTGFVP
ncbi:hypothetical protein [Streptomyces sp. NBC_01408]|uniref:hypothetical protein n=1 Tax=Streptomyces sp. NBC_01408 TaxID=2903855 RepID=UPI00225860E2|nr:hypothetical protein [Streptomyces sp. NBC_01408]MCX4695541.1 hypothetical protein [Streptomyces sp. NBC_01408]